MATNLVVPKPISKKEKAGRIAKTIGKQIGISAAFIVGEEAGRRILPKIGKLVLKVKQKISRKVVCYGIGTLDNKMDDAIGGRYEGDVPYPGANPLLYPAPKEFDPYVFEADVQDEGSGQYFIKMGRPKITAGGFTTRASQAALDHCIVVRDNKKSFSDMTQFTGNFLEALAKHNMGV